MELILVIILLILLFGGGFGYYRGSLDRPSLCASRWKRPGTADGQL